MEDIGDLIEKFDSSKVTPNAVFVTALMRGIKKHKIRRSDLVVKYGMQAIRASTKESEVWSFYEQLAIAAMDVGEYILARSCLQSLKVKFPNSGRVSLLEGMLDEARGDFGDALIIYNKLLEANPANLLAMKRKVCICKANGEYLQAIELLNKLLETYSSDTTSWLELTELYIAQSDYTSAAFCLEETILLTPTWTPFHIRLAEVYFTLGGQDGLLKARRHYTLALSMKGGFPGLRRTLYGLIATCRGLLAIKKHQSSSDGPVTEALLQTTFTELAALAEANGEDSNEGRVLAAFRAFQDE